MYCHRQSRKSDKSDLLITLIHHQNCVWMRLSNLIHLFLDRRRLQSCRRQTVEPRVLQSPLLTAKIVGTVSSSNSFYTHSRCRVAIFLLTHNHSQPIFNHLSKRIHTRSSSSNRFDFIRISVLQLVHTYNSNILESSNSEQ